MSVEYVLNAPLPKGAGLAKVTIEAEDIGLWCAHKWRVNPAGYVYTFIKRQCVYLHRRMLGDPPGLDCDHVNNDPLDNRRANLRAVPHAVNLQNRKGVRSGSKWRFRGVRPNGKGFQATAMVAGKLTLLGTYPTEEEANAVLVEWRSHNMPGSREYRERE